MFGGSVGRFKSPLDPRRARPAHGDRPVHDRADGSLEVLRRSVVLAELDLTIAAGTDDGADRAQRLRQVDAAPSDDRAGPARYRHDHDRGEELTARDGAGGPPRAGVRHPGWWPVPAPERRDNVDLMARYLRLGRGRIEDRLAELAELTRFPDRRPRPVPRPALRRPAAARPA